jgi:uncharacterized coiled-coil protein SlyX
VFWTRKRTTDLDALETRVAAIEARLSSMNEFHREQLDLYEKTTTLYNRLTRRAERAAEPVPTRTEPPMNPAAAALLGLVKP